MLSKHSQSVGKQHVICWQTFSSCSSLFDSNIYVEQLWEVMIQFGGATMHLTAVLTVTSFFLGMCLYINAMVVDMEEQINGIESILSEQKDHRIPISLKMIREIRFHCEIIE